jgi:hypothetical protein
MSKRKQTVPDSFKAVTWNVYHGTPVSELEVILRQLIKDGVSLFLLQEVTRPDVVDMLRRNGLGVFRHGPEFVVAWKPVIWRKRKTRGVRLSQATFFRPATKKQIALEAAEAVLVDRAARKLTALSYHLPSDVQNANAPAPRMTVLRQAMKTMTIRARHALSRAVLYGGDDNVDEGHGYGKWHFMRQPVTGLRLTKAPRPTHGNRRIDDFRSRGLIPGSGHVLDGGGDHKIHVRTFTWRKP